MFRAVAHAALRHPETMETTLAAPPTSGPSPWGEGNREAVGEGFLSAWLVQKHEFITAMPLSPALTSTH
jgi:hypothetical protein